MIALAHLMMPVLLGAPPPESQADSNRPVRIPVVGEERSVDSQIQPAHLDRPPLTSGDDIDRPSPLADVADSEGRKPMAISPASGRRGIPSGANENGSLSVSSGKSLAWWSTTGVGLAVVLAVILAGGKLARRVVPGVAVGESAGPIQILHRTLVSPKHSLALIRCGDRLLLLGMSGDRMTPISEIHDPQEIDFIRGQLMQTRPRSTTQAFRDLLSGSNQIKEAERSSVVEESSVKEDHRADADASSNRRTEFPDMLSSLRDQIARWKSRTPTT